SLGRALWLGCFEARTGRRGRSSVSSPIRRVVILRSELGGELGAVPRSELLEDVRHMTLDGLAGEEEPACDVRVGVAGGDEAGDLELTRGQRAAAVAAAAPGADAEHPQLLDGELLLAERAHSLRLLGHGPEGLDSPGAIDRGERRGGVEVDP